MDVIIASTDISASILAHFLTWKGLAALDHALCAKRLRENFHSTLCANDLEFHQPILHCSGLPWLGKRKCKAAFLDIEIPEEDDPTTRELTKWLNKWGHYVKSLQARTVRTRTRPRDFVLAVTTKCVNLERLSVTGRALGELIVIIPLACKKLTHLFLQVDDHCINKYILNSIGSLCTNLTHLYIDGRSDATVDWGFVKGLKVFHHLSFEKNSGALRNSPSLMELSTAGINGEDLPLLLQYCPKLSYFGCMSATLTAPDLEAVKSQLGRLRALSLGTWEEDTTSNRDEVVLFLVRNASHLRSLLYGVCVLLQLYGSWGQAYNRMIFNRMDEFSIDPAVLAEGLSPLQELIVASIGEAALVEVLKQCPQLRLLRMHSLHYDLSEGEVGRLLASRNVPLQWELELAFDTTPQQLQYVSRLSGIVQLHVGLVAQGMSADAEQALQAGFGLNSRTLRQLTLRNCGSQCHFSRIVSLLSRLPRLEKASVTTDTRFGIRLKSRDSMFQALKTVCPRLREFSTDFAKPASL